MYLSRIVIKARVAKAAYIYTIRYREYINFHRTVSRPSYLHQNHLQIVRIVKNVAEPANHHRNPTLPA